MAEANDDALFDQIWNVYIPSIKELSRVEAKANTEGADRQAMTVVDALDGIRAFVPGYNVAERLASSGTPLSPQKRVLGWWSKNVTGFIGITTALTVVFGILGLIPVFRENIPEKFVPIANSFLEIAKIFAGALVGGAAGVAAGSRRS